MYQLTIADNARSTTSEHPDWEQAHRALIDYVIDADYYLRVIHAGRPHTRYDLLDLGESTGNDGCLPTVISAPRAVGQAVIEELVEASPPVDSPYYAAAAAQRWIHDHQDPWNRGSADDPGARYPLAVLTAAQAEARHWCSAGALLREAAHLAGVEPITYPHQPTLETLRHNATRRRHGTMCPAELAATVEQLLPAGTAPVHTAALIWWFALLTWGAGAP